MNERVNTYRSAGSVDWGSRRPLYIAIEGVKGVGKSTVMRYVLHQLVKEGKSFVTLNPTQKVSSNYPLEYLNERLPLEGLDWWREHLYASRSQIHTHQAAMKVRQSANTHQPVEVMLGDRSIFTSLVTRWPQEQSIHSVKERFSLVRELERDIPIPDHIIYLRAPLEVIEKRLSLRLRQYGQHDEQVDRLKSACQSYRWLSTHQSIPEFNSKWHIIDASHTAYEVAHNVMARVKMILKWNPSYSD